MFRFCSKTVPERGRRTLRRRSGERSVALQILPPHARHAMVIRYARMCAYMERASFGALSSFMYPLLCRFMHDLFLFLFFSLASRKNGGKKNLFISNYHRSGVTIVLRPFRRHFMPTQRKRHCCRLQSFLTMLLNVVETQRENLDDYFK